MRSEGPRPARRVRSKTNGEIRRSCRTGSGRNGRKQGLTWLADLVQALRRDRWCGEQIVLVDAALEPQPSAARRTRGTEGAGQRTRASAGPRTDAQRRQTLRLIPGRMAQSWTVEPRDRRGTGPQGADHEGTTVARGSPGRAGSGEGRAKPLRRRPAASSPSTCAALSREVPPVTWGRGSATSRNVELKRASSDPG